MRIIIGTVFTAKINSMEYTVHRRVESPTGVTVDFVDKQGKIFKGATEQSILDKLYSGDIVITKLLDVWTPKTSLEVNGNSVITELKLG
jgi:hypothetical protein